MYSDLVVTCLYPCYEKSGKFASRSIDTYFRHAERTLSRINVPKICFAEPGELSQRALDTGWFDEVIEWPLNNSWLSNDNRLGDYQKIVGTKVQWLAEAASLFLPQRMMWVDFGLGRGLEDKQLEDNVAWEAYEVNLPVDSEVPSGKTINVEEGEVIFYSNSYPLLTNPLDQYELFSTTETTTKNNTDNTMKSVGHRPVKAGVFLLCASVASSFYEMYKELYNYIMSLNIPTREADLNEIRYKVSEEVVFSCMPHLNIKDFRLTVRKGHKLPAVQALFFGGVIGD